MNIIYSEKKLGLSIEIKLKGPWKIFKSTMKKEERRMKKEERRNKTTNKLHSIPKGPKDLKSSVRFRKIKNLK